MKRIGLALGGGGAKGFGHLPFLEVFDELGVRPSCISGTSIGAILGTLYAAGRTGEELRKLSFEFANPSFSIKGLFKNRDPFNVLDIIDPDFSFRPSGLLKGEKLLTFLYNLIQASRFEDLEIPMKVIATDFWRNQQVVFEHGDLLHAVRASMALPYIFAPIKEDDRILVDGGLVNNVPHDVLDQSCDILIGIDIMGNQSTSRTKTPSPIDAVFHTYQVMIEALTVEKRHHHPIDIFVHPRLLDVDLLDFTKVEEIYAKGLAAKEEFKRHLADLLDEKPKRNVLPWRKREVKRKCILIGS